MAEYIEREAAKRIVDDINTWSSGWRDYAKLQMDSLPAADVVARDCFDKILAENDDMRAIIDAYGGLENIQSAFVKLHEIETADVAPVVLCKHCRWAVFTPYGKAYGCRLLSAKPNYLLGITEDFFCAYGDDMREVEHD